MTALIAAAHHAQERSKVAKRGWESGVDKRNTTTAADLGLRRDQIHEAHLIRDAEFGTQEARAIRGRIEDSEVLA